jgi:hypothetical protein
VIADLAVNFTERQALLCGFTVERIRSDYGIDLLLFSFDSNGEIESGYVSIQVKATESLDWLASDPAAAFRIGRKDLVGWLRQSLPAILVAYDAGADRAYWIHVQAYFASQPGFNLFTAAETITVRIPRDNGLDPTAIRQFVEFRNQAGLESTPR